MANTPPGSPGLLKSLRTIFARLLATFQTRAELLSVEWQEERHRLIELLLPAASACVCGIGAHVALCFRCRVPVLET